MNPEIKKEWLKRLRSGEYQQGKKALRKNGCYCCLGVLCDLIDPSRWSYLRFLITGEDYYRSNTGESHVANPPNDVLVKSGLSFHDAGRLAGMNDNGDSFAEIADYIEAKL